MKQEEIREKLITAGVGNLKQFGYPFVTADSILTDEIYSSFFEVMLLDNLGKAGETVDTVIEGLLKEVRTNAPS